MSINPYQPPAEISEPTDSTRAVGPTAAKVFGTLNLLFGIFGVCCLGFSGALMFVPFGPQMSRDNVPLQLMEESPLYRAFNQAEVLFGFISSVILIVAGIGLLRLRPYGRTLSIGYGIYAIAMDALSTTVNLGFVFPILFEKANAAEGGIALVGVWAGLIGGISGTVLGLVYAGLLLYFMYRPNMVAAFEKKK